MDVDSYKVLESIKCGVGISGKYNSAELFFKTPNILIVFSNTDPDKSSLSMDRWRIFIISKDLENLEEKGVKSKKFKSCVGEESIRMCESPKVNINMNNDQQGIRGGKEKNIFGGQEQYGY